MGEFNETFKVLLVDDEPNVEAMFRQRMRRDIRSGAFGRSLFNPPMELPADMTFSRCEAAIALPELYELHGLHMAVLYGHSGTYHLLPLTRWDILPEAKTWAWNGSACRRHRH